MFNWLIAIVKCPYCGNREETKTEFKLGFLNLHEYRLGDLLNWDGGGKSYYAKQPQTGNYIDEAYVECPNCQKDFWLKVFVVDNRLDKIEVDVGRKGYLT